MLISPPPMSGTFPDGKRLVDYEPLAKVCASFLVELFDPESSSSTNTSLPYFIAMALAHAQLPDSNALAALILLQRLKSHNPNFTLSSPPLSTRRSYQRAAERLFLSAYLAAAKVLNDDRYRMQFWVGVGQNKFDLEELSRMEKEFLEEVDWDVQIDDATLVVFELMIGCRLNLLKKQQQRDDDRWGGGSRAAAKPRSDSTESESSSTSTSTSTSSDSSSSGEESYASPAASPDSAPATPSSLAMDISPMLGQIRRSKEHISNLDRRIEELQEQYNSLMQKSPSPRHHSAHLDAQPHAPHGHIMTRFRKMFK